MRSMALYFIGKFDAERTHQTYNYIEELIISCIKSVATTIIKDRHYFELYGFDILLDRSLKLRLIEINSTPSMTVDSLSDYETKLGLLEDVLKCREQYANTSILKNR